MLGQHHRHLFRLVSPIERAPQSGIDWQRVSKLARRLKLSGLLLSRLRAEHQVPEPILAQIRHEAISQGAVGIKAVHALRQIAAETHSQELPLMILKGARAVRDIYQSAAQRVMSDLDVLVRLEDFERFQAILLNLGYEARSPDSPKTEFHTVFERGQVLLEVHWAFGGGINASAEIWERTVTLDAPGVLGLGAEDRLLYLCGHICRHQMVVKAYHYCDLAYLIGNKGTPIDYELLGRLVPTWGRASNFALVIAVLRELFPELETGPLERAVGEIPLEEELVAAALDCVLAPRPLVYGAHRISQRSPTPSLLLPDDLMRLMHNLPDGAPVSWGLHLRTLGERTLGWFGDRRKLSSTPALARRAQEQARLNSWLSDSQADC